MHRDVKFLALCFFALSTCLMTTGCGSKTYTPTAEAAKETLNRALTAWQKGEKSDALEKESPPINVSIADWGSGKILEKFEIGAEQSVPGEGNKLFVTTLRLKGAKADTKTKFVVIGHEPIWVYGENDFKNLLNMDNNKPAPKSPRR